MPFKTSFRFIKRLFRNLYFLMFLNGFLLASMFYFKMESSYEAGLFASIKYNIDNKVDKDDTRDSIVVKAMGVCHELMNNRANVFNTDNTLGVRDEVFHSSAVDLMTTKGACGSYAQVLATIISTYHYPVRIAQMKAGDTWAAHNIVEVNATHGWVVLDPTFNVYFVKPDGQLASFADVKANWSYYAKQVPPGYDMKYRFEDVRYSNWTKVPIIFPAVKNILNLAIGKDNADVISMRTIFLHVFNIYIWISLLIYIPIFLFTIRRLIQTKVFPSPDIPFTFSNFIKYARSQMSRENTGLTR